MGKEQEYIQVDELMVGEDNANYPILASKISFFNRGKYPVSVGYIKLVPGATYQVNYEHPHLLRKNWRILFDLAATPSSPTERAALGLEDAPLLVIQTMTPFIN